MLQAKLDTSAEFLDKLLLSREVEQSLGDLDAHPSCLIRTAVFPEHLAIDEFGRAPKPMMLLWFHDQQIKASTVHLLTLHRSWLAQFHPALPSSDLKYL